MDIENISHELGVPLKQIKPINKLDKILCLVHNSWLKTLANNEISDCKCYIGTNIWNNDELQSECWSKIYVRVLKKQPGQVIPLPRCNLSNSSEPPLSYCQLLHYVSQSNHKNLWKAAHKKYSSQTTQSNKESSICHPAPYDIVLREVILRTYGCVIINKDDLTQFRNQDMNNQVQYAKMFETHSNIYPVLCGVETKSYIFLIHDVYIEHNLQDCVTYSPNILGLCYNKPLFIIYQLVNALKSMHDKGIVLGNITLDDIYLNEDLWIQIMNRMDCNLNEICDKSDGLLEYRRGAWSPKPSCVCTDCLKTLSSRWCAGMISNFDYLTILNNLAGRKIGEPSNHHVMPWVTDFTTRSGNNWRDLMKSKYRLNKGDCQLDLTYTQSTTKSDDVQQIPHHVSDVLSDITYYVYMARRMNKSVLTKHVRPLWVPGEYPNSIQRLQQWTPEECIPEFYSDPTVFKTIHEDLPDLKFPAWASCAEDFIAKHREALESQYVSERLHHWIDLTFGYKLTGTAAVKAKNVCLMLSDNNSHLCKTGIVQLFESPHPAKYMQGPFEGKLPPRIYMNSDKRYSVSPRLTRSSEDLTSRERDEDIRTPTMNKIQGSPQSQTSQKSQNISTDTERNNYHTVPKSATTTCNTIYLPKEYNPVAQLNALENLHAFSSKTFHTIAEEDVKTDKCHVEHSFDTSDDLGNSFVNRMFTESYEACLGKQNISSESNKSVDKSSSLNYKQIVAGCRLREMQILGCLVVEIFLAKKLRPLGTPIDFNTRFKNCVTVLESNLDLLPNCVKYAVGLLLQLDNVSGNKNMNFKYPMVTGKGLPPPSAHQLLQPLLSNSIFPFPNDYSKIYRLLTVLWEFENTSRFLDRVCYFECDGQNCLNYEHLERTKQSFVKKLSECKVKTYAAQIEMLLDNSTYEQFSNVEIILPFFEKLLAIPDTATLAAWYLFDPIAKSLGVQNTRQKLLEPILKLYEHNDCDTPKSYLTLSSIYRTKKSVKLYHHSFLLRLIVRFGLKCFLDNFSTCLIEAVGGYRDIKNIDLPFHIHRKSSGFIKSKSTKNLKYCEETISTREQVNKTSSPKKSSHTDALEPELFHFDDDNNKLLDVKPEHTDFILESDSVLDLQLNHSQAEEAIEENNFRLKDNFYNINVQKNFLDEQVLINDEYFSKDTIFDKSDCKFEVSECSTLKTETVLHKQSPEAQHKSLKSKYNLETTESPETSKSFAENYERKSSRSSRKSRACYSKISDMSSDSLIWLSHRLGPVLTARYLSRNLLKMLTLCYVGDENLQYTKECDKKSSFVHNLNDLTIADSRIVGDQNASKVLECLMSIAVLYGEHFILLQYLPHMSEMISLCRRRLSPNLQGGLLSSLQLLKHLLPYLSDVVLMDQLQDVLLKSILLPCVRLLGTTKLPYPGGSKARQVLARKFVDTYYALAVRIGAEMTREHLCVPGLQRFFLTFDKAFGKTDSVVDVPFRDNTTNEVVIDTPNIIVDDSNYLEIRSDGSTTEWQIKDSTLQLVTQNQQQSANDLTTADDDHSPPSNGGLIPAQNVTGSNEDPQIKAMVEIQDVFNLQLALSSYVPFLRLIGETYMEHCLLNHSLIRELCQKQYDSKFDTKMADKSHSKTLQINIPVAKNVTLSDNVGSSGSFGSSVAIIGNRIEVQNDPVGDLFRDGNTNNISTNVNQLGSSEMLALVSNKMDEHNSSRHLKGNWLAYWEHEIGRADKEHSFNMKQIKLQSFSGHTHAVRSLVILDNENSFMSGSRDKTVRLWSLRSQGDGSVTSPAQYQYTGHKKSVASLAFLEAPRLVASSDPSALHVWDPFVGRTVLCESVAGAGVIRPLGGHALLAGTTDGMVRIVDVRVRPAAQQQHHEWKVITNSSCGTQAIRCMCTSPSGQWIAVGLSSGWVSLLESRTGLVRAHWRAHDAELLQIVALGDHALVTSSLDHGIGVWSTKDGKCVTQLKGHSEPAHCLTSYHSELISGTTASRIGVHSCIESENPTFNSTKLRSETLKGLLTSMAVLPLNRMLLLGSDTGSISLLC